MRAYYVNFKIIARKISKIWFSVSLQSHNLEGRRKMAICNNDTKKENRKQKDRVKKRGK